MTLRQWSAVEGRVGPWDLRGPASKSVSAVVPGCRVGECRLGAGSGAGIDASRL
jgi:hypothetical protein